MRSERRETKKARYEVIQGEMLKKFKDKDGFIANVG